MKTNRIILTALAALCFAGCAKEIASTQEEQSVIKDGKTYVSVGETTLSKTVLDAADDQGVRKVYWQNGDCLNINGVDSKPLTGMGEKATNAVFEFDALLDFPYNVLYPASAWKDAGTVTLPSTQTYTADSFDPAAAVTLAAAASAGDKITLKSPCAVIKLSVAKDKDECVLKTLAFSGKAGEQVCGDFTADFANATLTGKSDAAADKTLKMDISSLTLGDEAKDIYIVVPAGTYASGFHIRISDVKGHFMDQDKSSSVTLAPGKVYSFPAITYTPTGTAVEIGTADEYLAFVDDFNKGVYGTKDATVSVEVLDDLDFTGKTFKTMGNANYEFSGTWNGNGKAMKNITATDQSMFYTPANATFTGIVIDESCSFTRSGANGGHWGIIARTIDSGTISDCDVNCDWNMDYGDGNFTYGTFCGRLNGKMTNCHMNGNLIYNRTKTSKVTNYLWIGGIVGHVNTSGEMTNCSTTGNVIFNEPAEDQRPTCVTSDKYFCVGGVVGKNLGKVTNCKMTGNFEYGDCPKDAFVGGVVGNTEGGTIDGCTMEGNIKAFQSAANSTDYARFFVGGVVGRAGNTAVVKNLSTKAGTTMEFGSAVLNLAAGGVVGSVLGTAVVENCVNNMTMTQKDFATVRAQYGGVIGAFSAGTVSNLENRADISVGLFNTASNSYLGCGGVLGYIAASVTGTITSGKSSIHNSGKIFCNAPDSCTGFGSASFGGVIGIQNGGDITNVTNSGMVHFDFLSHKSTTDPIKNVFAGGIVGDICAKSTVSGCTNSAQVKIEAYNALSAKRVVALGGIAGIVTPLNNLANGVANVVIKDCTFSSTIYSTNRNTTAPAWNFAEGKFEGCIVGGAKGTSASYTTIENCKVETSSGNQYSAYGYFGGIIGGSMYVNIKNCTVKTTLQGFKDQESTRAIYLSGIAAYARYSNISGCKLDNVKVNYFLAFAGLSYQANGADQTFENNTVDVTVTSPKMTSCYMLATKTNAATVVQNNGVKGTINGVPVAEDNVKYCESAFTCDPSKPNYIITD